MTRDKYTEKFTKPVHSDPEGVRLATPEIVADYIARRLETHRIADLGCGIGIQAIFFARYCRKVFAVERESEKLEYARENAGLYGAGNIEFIHGDVLSPEVIERLEDVDIIFSDPARPFEERERRLEGLSPPVPEVMRAYQDIDQMAFHLPPKIEPSKIRFDCEREYLSLNGQLNRFTVYLGRLNKCERSAVVLPGGARLESKEEAGSLDVASEPEAFLFEPEPSVVHAELLWELKQLLPEDTRLYYSDKTRTLLTSKQAADSAFLKDCYRVVGSLDFEAEKIKKAIQAAGDVRHVVLRFHIEPEEYWKMRGMLEQGLNGSRTLHVFNCNGTAVLCEKIKKEAGK